MSIAYDLPGCMSNAQESDDLRDLSEPSCETTSRCKRIPAPPSTTFRRAATTLAVLAALLAGALFPQAHQKAATEAATPMMYATRSTPQVSVQATDSEAAVSEVDLALGQPQAAPSASVEASNTSTSSAASADVAQIAMAYVGYPYAYGAAGPYAFDCSGLTQFVYSQVGVYLPHSAGGQFSWAYGQILGSMSELQPGDLVFFANTYGYGISHAAIYIGNGMMVSAGTPWTGVALENIYAGYWLSHYAGALRPYR